MSQQQQLNPGPAVEPRAVKAAWKGIFNKRPASAPPPAKKPAPKRPATTAPATGTAPVDAAAQQQAQALEADCEGNDAPPPQKVCMCVCALLLLCNNPAASVLPPQRSQLTVNNAVLQGTCSSASSSVKYTKDGLYADAAKRRVTYKGIKHKLEKVGGLTPAATHAGGTGQAQQRPSTAGLNATVKSRSSNSAVSLHQVHQHAPAPTVCAVPAGPPRSSSTH